MKKNPQYKPPPYQKAISSMFKNYSVKLESILEELNIANIEDLAFALVLPHQPKLEL